nr:16S rRNA (uracil(1498)-N(3))-methyltransferase [Sunxiuqinia sp.]
MQIFYMPVVLGNEITLDETESKHVVKSMRLGKGDKVQVVDGKGGCYTAEITEHNTK